MTNKGRERLLRIIGCLEGLMIAIDQDAIANGLDELDSLLEGEEDDRPRKPQMPYGA